MKRFLFTIVTLSAIGCGSGSPTGESPPPVADTPDPTGRRDIVFSRWQQGAEISNKLRTGISEVWVAGLRPAAIADYHRAAHRAYQGIPRDCADTTVHEFLDIVTQAERDIVDVYDQCGSDSKFERLTPDEVSLWSGWKGAYFKIRESSEATERINKTVVDWREKLRAAESKIIGHIESTYKKRPVPW